MISGEAPIVFAKACEIFILELTLRAWTNTEENKRRTLQRSDVAAAVSKNDTFDFLIDIVPREESKPKRSDVHNPFIHGFNNRLPNIEQMCLETAAFSLTAIKARSVRRRALPSTALAYITYFFL